MVSLLLVAITTILSGCGPGCKGKDLDTEVGQIVTNDGKCLDHQTDVVDCNGHPKMQWCWIGKKLQNLQDGLCLANDGPHPDREPFGTNCESPSAKLVSWYRARDYTLRSYNARVVATWDDGSPTESIQDECLNVKEGSIDVEMGACDKTKWRFEFQSSSGGGGYCPYERRLGGGTAAAGTLGWFFVSTVGEWATGEVLDKTVSWFSNTGSETGSQQRTGDCIPYPKEFASFCASRHEHRVSCIFKDQNLAMLRNIEAEKAWKELKDDAHMQKVIGSHRVCSNTVLDSICLDAFPMCYCSEDLTPCLIACNNFNDCLRELDGNQTPATVNCRQKCSKFHPTRSCAYSVSSSVRQSPVWFMDLVSGVLFLLGPLLASRHRQ